MRTSIPVLHGVVHEAGVPFAPSISTTQSRHDPNASRLSVAHSFGMSMPACLAARITDVPAGTCTAMPSIVTSTVASPRRAGVPKSGSRSSVMTWVLPSDR